MPLSKARNKERMKQIRLHKEVKVAPVQPKPDIKARLEAAELKLDGHKIVGVVQPVCNLEEPAKLYNPAKRYQPGDRVLVQNGRRLVEVTMPELDADGNPVPLYR